jgi:hypothetical protein
MIMGRTRRNRRKRKSKRLPECSQAAALDCRSIMTVVAVVPVPLGFPTVLMMQPHHEPPS